mmetsp:Transcript_92444/g.178152  ORF Transcript_92444/g.178152 Transcript_92444/m.178152 type:complete len:214 (-) Transcript_92444:71-712(-)
MHLLSCTARLSTLMMRGCWAGPSCLVVTLTTSLATASLAAVASSLIGHCHLPRTTSAQTIRDDHSKHCCGITKDMPVCTAGCLGPVHCSLLGCLGPGSVIESVQDMADRNIVSLCGVGLHLLLLLLLLLQLLLMVWVLLRMLHLLLVLLLVRQLHVASMWLHGTCSAHPSPATSWHAVASHGTWSVSRVLATMSGTLVLCPMTTVRSRSVAHA